ncbi:MAG: 6-bladed beta-propeller [Balneola sp.]
MISRIPLLLIFIIWIAYSQSLDAFQSEKKEVISNPEHGIWQDRNESPINFKKAAVFGSNDQNEQALYTYGGIAVDEKENLYFLDKSLSQIIAFDKKGELKWKIGRSGKGPGELENTLGIATDDKHIYVSNIRGTRIDKFDLNGQFVRSFKLPKKELGSNIEGFTKSGELVLSKSISGKFGDVISFYDVDSMNKIRSFEIDAGKGLKIPRNINSSPGIQVYDTLIANGSIVDFSFGFYNISGEKVIKVRKDFNKIVKPTYYSTGKKRGITDNSKVRPPLVISDEHYLVFSWWTDNLTSSSQKLEWKDREFKHSLDLFRKDGTLLFSEYGDGIRYKLGNFIYVDRNGFLYTKEENMVIKYSVLVN